MSPPPTNHGPALRLEGLAFILFASFGVVAVYLFSPFRGPPESRPVNIASVQEVVVPPRIVPEVKPAPLEVRQVCDELARRNQPPLKSDLRDDREHRSSDAENQVVPKAYLDNQTDLSMNFVRDIQPILVDHCYRCHGPGRQEAGIRFDRRETIIGVSLSGATPVLPGDSMHSAVIARVTSNNSLERMPLDGPPLSSQEISSLKEWITEGATWSENQEHWAFVKPKRPCPPNVNDTEWSRNSVDDFVLKRLESERLPHSEEADRETVIRRLSLDLTGLPPTPDDVDNFVFDSSQDAYERLTDRLMASPHFGEKWAIRWLDLARFADTNGFEFDRVRTMWLYRDWVIEALNCDLPFDQFTVEQIAGDLIPNSTVQQQVATGFVRCSAVATDVAMNRFDMIVDRVNTLGTTWLGLTFSCAQCHDHKFDPLTQKEFYRLYAMFNNSIDEMDGLRYGGLEITAVSPINGLLASTLVLSERSQPNVTFLKVRGSPAVDGEQVEPGLPAFLHAAKCGAENRLSLACWLIDKDNPLTSRVAVNRMWESLFGIGIVRTSEDFGLRGERPSHLELLDWLATEFQRGEWSSKRMLRQIVASATYRQASHLSDELLECDPQNRLLTRGPRFRVDAELIRDIALASSGMLSRKLGGPSVFPWQPPGVSEKLEFAGFSWKMNPDEDRFRRGLYTHWKRTALYPSFSIFDAPNRTGTCARRTTSSTPLQALVTLNDPVFFEAAVFLGKRMLEDSDTSLESTVTRGFRLCVARNPTAEESETLVKLYGEELNRLTHDPDTAKALLGGDSLISQYPHLGIVEWAAASTVANVLLNLDETITKE